MRIITVIIALFYLALVACHTPETENKNNEGTTERIPNQLVDTAQSPISAEEQLQEKWTTVYTFKGNGMKKSPVFELMGGESRLKYKYEGQSGMGMFAVYVVEEGIDIMKEGGIPEVMTQAVSEASESSLQKTSGRYYLNVNAVGSWVVTVEEMK